jgi:hypothetical protein
MAPFDIERFRLTPDTPPLPPRDIEEDAAEEVRAIQRDEENPDFDEDETDEADEDEDDTEEIDTF